MKKIISLFILIVAIAGCSVYRTNISIQPEKTHNVHLNDTLSYYKKNHAKTKRSADAIFDSWTETNHTKSLLNGKHIVSICIKEEEAVVTYDFELIAGGWQRAKIHCPYKKN